MGSIDEIMQVCRLCLVKDKVNIPIFDESNNSEEIFNKICSCLPVKVSREDNLPKKICDGCSYKLELLYTFRNTSVDSEKQLMSLLNQAGLSACSLNSTLVRDATKPEVLVKQETLEPADSRMENENSDVCPDAQSYIMQQQQLPYQQDFAFAEASGSSEVPTEEPPPKRARRSNPVKKPPVQTDSEDEDLDLAMQITKAEDEDSDDVDQPDYVEPSTSADDQPGPSGVGKDVVEAPNGIDSRVPNSSDCDENQDFRNIEIKEEKLRDSVESPRTKPVRNRVWRCTKCETQCSTRAALKIHRKIHRPIVDEADKAEAFKYDPISGRYACNTCFVEFTDKDELNKHLKEHVEEFSCDVCNERIANAYNFSCHVQSHGSDSELSCPLCGFCTEKRTAMRAHVNKMHYQKFSYKCKTCGKGFDSLLRFKDHDNEHLGSKPYVCIVCSKSFTHGRYLTYHQIRYHSVGFEGQIPKNQCKFCFKIFFKNDSLEKHLTSMHLHDKRTVKKHLCDTCGKGFATKDKLETHDRTHSGIKPFICNFCSKGFIKKEYLVMHERIHTGERPYSCPHCDKRFNQAAPLRIHIRGHTGEKPYVCTFCQTGFTSKGALDTHKRTCKGIFH